MNTENVFIAYGTNIYNCGRRYTYNLEENYVVYRMKTFDKYIYVDLFTKTRYKTSKELSEISIGDRVIGFAQGMIPINDIIDVDKKHMTMNKIKKKIRIKANEMANNKEKE